MTGRAWMIAAAPCVKSPPVSERRIMGKLRSTPATTTAHTVSAMKRPMTGL